MGSEMCIRDRCEMIEEINETQVEEEEVLSNRAYYYECDTGKLLF